MIKLVINGMVVIKNLPEAVYSGMVEDLTMKNPKYEAQIKAGRDARFTEPFIQLYVQRGSSLIVPRGYMNRALYRMRGHQYEIVDKTVAPELQRGLVFKGKLRDYQEAAVADGLKRRYGIIEAGTGAGKTIVSIAIISERKTPALVIVHNTELLLQWKERIKEFLGYDVGIIGNGKYEIKDITVGIINSVTKKAVELSDRFGFIVVDECHRAGSSSHIDVINTMRPKFHLGVTATPFRSDGLTRVLYALIGPKLHVVNKQMLEDTGAILVPEVHKIVTQFYVINEGQYTYAQIISALVQSTPRNLLIAETVIKDVKTYKDSVLVVSDRVSHCVQLAELLSSFEGVRPIVLHGRLAKNIRIKAMEDFRAGKYNVLVATISLIGEGFDCPDLSAIFLTTPVRFSGRVLQSIGRIVRPSGSAKPRVHDFRDYAVGMLKYSGFARDRLYKQMKWE